MGSTPGKRRFAVLSPVLPPYSSGQAVMLYRLLEPFAADDYCLLSCYRPEILGPLKRATAELPATTYHLRTFSKPQRFMGSGLAKLSEAFRYAADIAYRARQIRTCMRTSNATALIVCSGDFADMAAAWLVSRSSSVRVVPYMFDYFSYQQTGFFRRVSTWLEGKVLQRAYRTIVPNEQLELELQRRYGAQSIIIRNPCELPELASVQSEKKRQDGLTILYTGAIYDAQYDAIARLVQALEAMPDSGARLHLYTSQLPEDLTAHGIGGAYVVFHEHLKQEEIPRIQMQADVLFLPLSFEEKHKELILTSAPGKMGEYMAAERPILAHVPPGSFVEWYLEKNHCGISVTSTELPDLEDALRKLLSQPALRTELGKNGRKAAERDYSLPLVQKKFRAFTEELTASPVSA